MPDSGSERRGDLLFTATRYRVFIGVAASVCGIDVRKQLDAIPSTMQKIDEADGEKSAQREPRRRVTVGGFVHTGRTENEPEKNCVGASPPLSMAG